MFKRNPAALAPAAALVFLSVSSVLLLQGAASDPAPEYTNSVQPFLGKNCYVCHNQKLKSGDLDLAFFKTNPNFAEHSEVWEKVLERVGNGTMPPKGLPRPPQADLDKTTGWIRGELARLEREAKPDPGRVTARRLNRAEYNNTIRDLLGVDFRPADDFPQDDSGYGFDNIGDVLSLSPVLMEKYLKAAESVVRTALHGPEVRKPTVLRHQPPDRQFTLLQKAPAEYDESGLSLPNAVHTTLRFPADGEYTIRVALEGRRPAGSEPAQIAFWLDGKLIHTLTLEGSFDGGSFDLFGAQSEFKHRVSAGDHWVAASVFKIYEGLPPSYGGPNPSKKQEPAPRDPMRFVRIPEGSTPEQIAELKKKAEARAAASRVPANRVWVHYLEALGPYNQSAAASPEVLKRVFTCGHASEKAHTAACNRKVLGDFARRAFRRAFRRPVTGAELAPYLNLVADTRRRGSSFSDSIGTGLVAFLVSPDFLFRIERPGTLAAADKPAPLTDYALASRLSYFLWSTMPDDELMRAAAAGALRKPESLNLQVRRMLRDPKARALVDNFAGQWLELRRLESVAPDREKFPEFDDYLRMSMRHETESFFENLIREDGNILDLLDAKYSFLNEKLARFYGIPGVKGPEFRRVDLKGTPRGGILTHGSVLTVSSYATRTSPVLRGKWILENVLNTPPPAPPPNVPALDEAQTGTSASMRMQMEEHRKNPVCASCHSTMDPLGFAFENFDAIGKYRTHDGKFPVDATGELPGGRAFKGADELTALLRKDRTQFAECVTDKMLTFALGRGLERYDRRTVKDITAKVAAKDYKFSALVLEIVNSLPFQMRRGDRS